VDRKEPTNAFIMWVQDCQLNVCQQLCSVTLNDPHVRPDIYGKIRMEFQFVVWMMLKIIFWFRFGACHDFSSMTINGPAPMLLGFSWMLQLINNVNCT
jgi:hypothetical protein